VRGEIKHLEIIEVRSQGEGKDSLIKEIALKDALERKGNIFLQIGALGSIGRSH
jgi:hypothetical protein